MNEIEKQQAAALFPRASESFRKSNPELFAAQREQTDLRPLESEASGQTKSDGRPVVRVILYRVRLLDSDNANISTKSLIDCLCEVGLIPGDATDQIRLEVTQEKVAHFNEQKTEVKITYP